MNLKFWHKKSVQDESSSVFAFADPISALERVQSGAVVLDGDYYMHPFNVDDLAKTFGANVHHNSAKTVKRDIALSTCLVAELLHRNDLEKAIDDYLSFGDAYLLIVKNPIGRVMKLVHVPAMYMYRHMDLQRFAFRVIDDRGFEKRTIYHHEQIVHISRPSLKQEIYGVPDYLSIIDAVFLNEAATLFRRKYYKNGAHAGFLLYMNDPTMGAETEKRLVDMIKSSKGLGNFKNWFINSKGQHKSEPKIIKIGEVDSKDDFFNIKNISRDDVLAAWRVPPQLMSILPSNVGGFGDATSAAKIFARNEIVPLQNKFNMINEQVGRSVVEFVPYSID